MPKAMERIHVALSIYDPSGTYSQNAGVVMTSIFENTSSPVTIHILHDETLTQDNREKFIKTAEKYSQEVNFIDITEQAAKISERVKKISDNWTVGSLYRLFIPQALPEIDKVIYLDCDIVVNLDIQELWTVNFEDKSLAGVKEIYYVPLTTERVFRMKVLECDVENYINSGVLVMNLKKLRAHKNEDFCEKSMKWLYNNAYLHKRYFTLYMDQDAVNAVYRGDIKFIDKKFNVLDNLQHDLSDSIIHSATIVKPWMEFTGQAYQKIYWKFFLKSAWGKNITPDELINMLPVMTNDNIKRSLTYRILSFFKRKMTTENAVVQFIRHQFVYFMHKLRKKFLR